MLFINSKNIYNKFYFNAVKVSLLACLIALFTPSLVFANTAQSYSVAEINYESVEEAYRVEKAKTGVDYYLTFDLDTIDENGNDVVIKYGILLLKADGSDTNSIAGVITSYGDNSFSINTSSTSSAYRFYLGYPNSSTRTLYYVVNANGGLLSATNNRNVLNASLYVGNESAKLGGALSITSSINSINADFIGNKGITSTTKYSTYAGALYNNSTINSITGNFVANNLSGNTTIDAGGGGVHNDGTIRNIIGNFIGNFVSGAGGGAIYNSSSITNIVGDFFANYVNSGTNSYDYGGGAIANYNGASIQSIHGNFIENFVYNSLSRHVLGGAIVNYQAYIGTITGDFISNSVYSAAGSTDAGMGGAIANSSESSNAIIDTISANFLLNSATGTGGAIANYGSSNYTSIIGSISGIFAENYAPKGGAIDNYINGSITSIVGEFISNIADSVGGGIRNFAPADSNTVKIGTISGSFVDNIADDIGGAIFNGAREVNAKATIDSITADFIKNISASGGAIYNESTKSNSVASIGLIEGDFYQNKATKNYGGAIYNSGTNASITKIIGDFFKNSASYGGAIYNVSSAEIGSLESSFTGNTASTSGGGIFNNTSSSIGDIKGSFNSNTAGVSGGGIYNNASSIGNITGSFSSNVATSTSGGGIFNNASSTIGDIKGSFNNNTAGASGGGIYNNASKIGNINGAFSYNKSAGSGGAIYNYNGTLGNLTGNYSYNSASISGGAIYNNTTNSIGTIIGSFIGNNATTSGGAIWTNSDLAFSATNRNITFSNNYTNSASAKVYNAIYSEANLDFNMAGTGSFTINDSIITNSDITFNGVNASNNLISLNDVITTTNDIFINNATLQLGSFLHDNGTKTSALDMTSGHITIDNDSIFRINAKDYNAAPQTSGYTGSILYGVAITGDTNSQWIIENISNGTYDYSDSNNLTNWAGTYTTGNSLQSIDMKNNYFVIDRVVNSVLYEGPMGDIIKEAAKSAEFGSLTNSLLANYIANTTDFIYGGTNWLVGTETQQAAFIEGSAKMSSVIGVNANTLHINRAGYESISLRRLDAYKRQRSILEEQVYASKINPENIIIYDANGRLKEEYRNEYELNTSAFKRVIEANNLTAWLAPMYHYEDVHGMASDAHFAGYDSTIYGAKMGIDITTQEPRSRSGLAFGAGKGSSISTGDFKDIENDYYFYSLSAYESFNISNWVLNANVGYTRMQNSIMHDISAFEMENLYADVDSFVWNLAFSAEYEKSLLNILFSPHIGLELAYLTSNDYKVKMGKNLGIIYNVDTQAQELALIPLGLKIEKEFKFGNWSILPELDLNLMAAFGEIDEQFYITAQGFLSDANLNGKVLDKLTYGADLSLLINYKNAGIGLNYNYDFSENRTAHSSALEFKFNF